MKVGRIFHLGLVALASVLLGLAGCGGSEPTTESAEAKYAALAEAYKDSPELLDKAIYADFYGISVEEAVARFALADEFGWLSAELEEKEAATFGGYWIQHQPDYKFIVAFTRDGEATMARYIPEDSLGYFEVRTVTYTYTELLAAQQEVMAALRDLGIPADSAGYVQNNNVEFYVTDLAPVEAAVADGRLIVPDCVAFVLVEGLSQPD